MQNQFFKKNQKEWRKKAFTLVEVLASLLILAVGVLSVIALSSKSYSAISLQKNKLIAANLAREGIELVHNVRNENWMYRGISDCNLDNTTTTCDSESTTQYCGDEFTETLGQVCEDNRDCDWRCGNENAASSKPTFKLGAPGNNGLYLIDIDYKGQIITSAASPGEDCTALLPVQALKVNNGFYEHGSGTASPFYRLIIIDRTKDTNGDSNVDNDLQVKVKVCWKERGGDWQEIMLEEHLYNWIKVRTK